jgi:hypothetical protein
VRHEIGDRHLAREDERDRPREQAEDEEDAADDLEDAGETGEREELGPEADVGEAEKLAGAVGDEEKRGDDAEERERVRRPSVEAGHVRGSLLREPAVDLGPPPADRQSMLRRSK